MSIQTERTERLLQEAQRLGFALGGVVPAVPASGYSNLMEWVRRGYAGDMNYFADRLPAYADPNRVMEGVVSIVMLTMNYGDATARHRSPVVVGAKRPRNDLNAREPPDVSGREAVGPSSQGGLPSNQPVSGRIARYAWGSADYHDLMHKRLRELIQSLTAWIPNLRARGVVDTAPLLEREYAELAGLGWIGKHTLLLNRTQGSWFFLAALLVNVELDYNPRAATDHCGTCTACLDACPTAAFPQPYLLDATRCISYLTIEHRSSIASGLREPMGDWLFGCDICQDVCPWNHKASHVVAKEFAPHPDRNPILLGELFSWDAARFHAEFRRTPLWCARRRGILRNAAIVLGNRPAENSLPALELGLNDDEWLVRGASAWALGRHLRWPRAQQALRRRREVEKVADVLEEIEAALHSSNSSNSSHLSKPDAQAKETFG